MSRTVRSIIADQVPLVAPAETSVRDAARLMKEAHVGALLVVEGGTLVGIFTERDLLCRVTAEGLDAKTTKLAAVMTRDPKTIDPDKPFVDVLHILHENSFRHVPVVEANRPVGMVSARDALGSELGAFLHEFVRQERIDHLLTYASAPPKHDPE